MGVCVSPQRARLPRAPAPSECSHSDDPTIGEKESSVGVFCLYSTLRGPACVRELAYADANADPMRVALPVATGATVVSGRTERRSDWHNTPQVGLTVILAGGLEIETGRTAPRRHTLAAGDLLLVLDRSGEGHRSRGFGSEGLTALLLPLAADAVSALPSLFSNWPDDFDATGI
jgi:hypothetical protein